MTIISSLYVRQSYMLPFTFVLYCVNRHDIFTNAYHINCPVQLRRIHFRDRQRKESSVIHINNFVISELVDNIFNFNKYHSILLSSPLGRSREGKSIPPQKASSNRFQAAGLPFHWWDITSIQLIINQMVAAPPMTDIILDNHFSIAFPPVHEAVILSCRLRSLTCR